MGMSGLSVKIGKLKLNNPVMTASGTFGYAEEFKDLLDLNKLGAIVTKTITLKPRKGNPMPRTCETFGGMLNSIGLENPGIDEFIEEKLSFLKNIGVPIIVSISSEGNPDELIMLAKTLNKIAEISAIELNISCPNLKSHQSVVHSPQRKTKYYGLLTMDYRLVSQDPQATYEVVKSVRKVTKKTIITKLSPNVTDIVEIAKAAEGAGADALSLINTAYGMAIDIETKRPRLARIVGGLSGPAIKPVALRMVWEVAKAIKIPVIGIGGIMNARDALEFIICGATAVQIGTANFVNPNTAIEIIDGIRVYMKKNKIDGIKELIGSLEI